MSLAQLYGTLVGSVARNCVSSFEKRALLARARRRLGERIKSHDHIDHCGLHFVHERRVGRSSPTRPYKISSPSKTGVARPVALRASSQAGISIDRLRGARGFPVAVGGAKRATNARYRDSKAANVARESLRERRPELSGGLVNNRAKHTSGQ